MYKLAYSFVLVSSAVFNQYEWKKIYTIIYYTIVNYIISSYNSPLTVLSPFTFTINFYLNIKELRVTDCDYVIQLILVAISIGSILLSCTLLLFWTCFIACIFYLEVLHAFNCVVHIENIKIISLWRFLSRDFIYLTLIYIMLDFLSNNRKRTVLVYLLLHNLVPTNSVNAVITV